MTANELFAWMEVMNPSPYTAQQKTLWLNDLEASLWTEVFLQPAGLWRPRKGSEGDRPLLLPESRRMLYAMYLWAMMDFARGEHGSYANSMALYNDHLAQLQCWYAETYAPAMTQAVWTEWAVYAPEDEEEPRCVMTLPGGCAVLGAECRVEEAGDLQNITLGTEGEPGEYMPAGTVPTDRKGLSRFFRFYEPYDRAVYAGGEGTGKVRFRLLLQPEARKGSHGAGSIPGVAGGGNVAGAVVAGEKGDPGKSAYQYALDSGYTGTEAEFATKLAEETPGIHIGPEAPADDSVLWVDTDEEAEEDSAEAATPDWNASEGEAGHVLNRPFYTGMAELVNGTGVWSDDLSGMIIEMDTSEIVAGKTYTVTYNGVDYICTAFEFDGGAGTMVTAIGNGAGVGFDDTGEPFMMAIMDGTLACMDYSGATEATIRIMGEKVFPIPYEYLPPLSYVIDVEDDTATNNNKSANITYDTTELVQFLKNGWPVWLNITGGSVDKRVQVTAWNSLNASIDEQIAIGGSPAAVMLYLCGKEIGLATEYKWVVGLNMTD